MIWGSKFIVAVCLSLQLALPWGSHAEAPSASGSDRVVELQGKLTTLRDYLKEKRADAHDGIIAKYRSGLDQVAKQLQAKADLAGLVAVRDEKKRVDEQEVLYVSHRSKEAALAAYQDHVLDRLESLDKYTADQLVSLADKWTLAMGQLKEELVRENDIDAASEAKQAVDQLAFTLWLVEAKTLLDEPVRGAASADHDDTNRGGRPRTRPSTKDESGYKGSHPLVPTLYEGGSAPMVSQKVSTRMDYPTTASRAAAAKTSGRVSVYRIDHKTSGTSSHWDDLPTSSERQIPRLTVRANGAHSFPNCIAVFEYFGRAAGASSSGAKRLSVESVSVPLIDSTPRTIDGGGYLYYRARSYDYTDASHWFYGAGMLSAGRYAAENTDSRSRHQGQLYGFTVSVYGDDGSLIFQRSSTSKANSLARNQFDERYHVPQKGDRD